MKKFDVIVIGAGSGGLTAAITLSGSGKSVLLIEKDKPGGECTHSGCVPSKALLHASKEGMSDSEAFKYTKDIVFSIYKEETPEKLEGHGITFIKGDAEFSDKCKIKVNEQEFEFKKAIISTGSSPRMINIKGLDEKYVLTNQNLFEQDEAPEKLLIIGTGPIGMEMAQAFSGIGSKITMASIDTRFGRLEDPAVSEILEKEFLKKGIDIKLNAYIKEVKDKTAFFEIKDGDTIVDTIEIVFNKVLIAIGRVPNIPNGLNKAGIKFTKRGIDINSNYRTTNKYVYAIGDVSLAMKFTHTANEAGRFVSKKILAPFIPFKSKREVPKVTYTSPEISQVGISWEQAKKKYGEKFVSRLEVPFSEIDRAKTESENGLALVFVKKLSGKILGANIIGKGAGELLAPITLAMESGTSMWKINKTVFPYPSYSEVIKKSSDKFAISSLKNLKVDIMNVIKKNSAKIIGLVFWGTIISCFLTYKEMSGLSSKDLLVELYKFTTGTVWGPIIYMAAYAIRPIIFFPATLMTMLSGALFGLPLGVLYTIIGENASANLAYWIGRFFGKGTNLEDSSFVGPWVKKLKDEPFISVLIMRFIYLPFDLTNYVSGILGVKWRAYFLATLLGILPGLTTFVGFGATLRPTFENATSGSSLNLDSIEIDWTVGALSLTIFIGSLFLARYFKKKHG